MPTKQEINDSLDNVLVPGIMRSVVKMNLVKEVTIGDNRVDISMYASTLSPEIQDRLKENIKSAIGKLGGAGEVEISFTDIRPLEINKVKNVVAIMSGKGGVGKSLVTGLVAISLRRQGYDIGILDADITGPSIPKMFGIEARPYGSDTGIMPVPSRSGIELMSINLLLPGEDEAVIWRGPLIGKTITQFWEDVLWGQLDCLLVDLPPGTADAPLTVLQSLPVSGIIIVFTPQDLTNMVVRKAVNMAQKMEKPILGVVENMSYLYISEIDKKMEIFGPSRGDDMAQTAAAPLLARIPIDPDLARLCDEGSIERYSGEIMTTLDESLHGLAPFKK